MATSTGRVVGSYDLGANGQIVGFSNASQGAGSLNGVGRCANTFPRLGLPVREMRLHIHPFEGSGDGLCGSFHRAKEPITVTRAEIIYQRRIAVLDHAVRVGNVAEACRIFGISRTRYYEWKGVADRYGLAALMPKERRAPQMPEATPTHVLEALLTLAVLEPTIGCRQYADRLGDQGFSIAKSTVQKHLVAHGLGKRSQRLARAAAIAAATTGLVTEAAQDDEPFGFCLASAGPGELVCLDSFYVGKLKGVGKVYQLTAIDVFTRWAFVAIVLGPPTGAMTARFIAQMLRIYQRHGIRVRAVLSDIQADCALGSTVRPAGGGKLRGDRCPLCIAADRSERFATPCLLGVSRAGATPGKERPVRYSVTGPGRIPVGECPARPPRWRHPSVFTRQGGMSATAHTGSRCRLPGRPSGQPG